MAGDSKLHRQQGFRTSMGTCCNVPPVKSGFTFSGRFSIILAMTCSVAIILVVGVLHSAGTRRQASSQSKTAQQVLTFDALLKLPSEGLAKYEIAALNLACAENLPGAEHLALDVAQATLQSWAQRVKSETEKYLHKFRENPADFNNSEAYFRVLTMITVLQQDFGVRYNMSRAATSEPNDTFFADSSDLFLHGILGPRHTGTCASMPVLYVAVGRKLGYPLKLVTTKGHLFARWEDSRDRFNIEGTNEGLNCFPDEYYRHWPFELTGAEVKSGRYLRSLTAQEELALFMQTRGMCLKAAGRFSEARIAWERARQLAPDWTENVMLIASVSQR